ncbi:MAG TPA: ArsR family transcriptional regulator [Dehalococcoidia bacterium]|nr:ArsR family transcriptional regulator [Dehalococcoidia bacterium]
MESTRAKIVELLRRRHEATVEDLTQALELAPATVRRHLDILQRDGHVAAHPVRRETGRPHYVFALTERGHDLLPHHYIRVTSRLLQEIVALRPQETAGRTGRELADLVLERMADGLVEACTPRITASTLRGRLEQAVEALADEGIVFEVEPRGDEYVVAAIDCLCCRLSDGEGGICGRDQRLLGRLLNADVKPDDNSDDGACAYVVKPQTDRLARSSV